MAECRVCTRKLKDGTLQWKSGTWKSCPTCSELAGVHVFLRFPKDFGWRPSRTAPGGRIPQSRCYFHRDMGAKADECRLCGARDAVSYDDLDEASPSQATRPAEVVPEDVALTPAQLDALASDLVDWIELSPEGRKFLRTHVATERNAKNREFVLRLRGKKLTCDGCGVDLAAEYSSQHRRVVEVHHVRPLARGPRQAKGTAEFNVLCPTCHRVVHYRREEPLNMPELRALLGR